MWPVSPDHIEAILQLHTPYSKLQLVYSVHLCYGQLTPVKTRHPLASITWTFRVLKFRAHRGQLFFGPADQPLFCFCFFCFFSIRSQAQAWLTTKHFSRAFWGPTRLHGHTTSTKAFRVQVENGLIIFFLHFSPVSIQVWNTWLRSGPHWWLRSSSSQASDGYKLKAECLFLFCLGLLFGISPEDFSFW